MLGPVFGVALYSYADFELTFYIFAAVLSLGMIFVLCAIPNHLNHADDIMSKTEIDQYFERLRSSIDGRQSSFLQPNRPLMRSDAKTSQSSDVTYMMILKNRRAMMAVVSAIFAMIFMLFFDSILTVHLIKDMKINENTAGK